MGKVFANQCLALRVFLPWASRLVSIFKVRARTRLRQEAPKELHFRGAHFQDCVTCGPLRVGPP